MPDHIHDTFKISKDIGIPESDAAIAVPSDFIGPRSVGTDVGRLVMLAAIEFDNQFATVAGKIRDAARDRNLSAEVLASVLEKAKFLPKLAFRIGGVVSQMACKAIDHCATPTPNPSPQGGGE